MSKERAFVHCLIEPSFLLGIRMMYMCRTCKKKCDDIIKHLITVHKFSKTTVESQLQTNPNSYGNAFEKLE